MDTLKRKRSAWFAFYPDDFIGGTRGMSLSGKGAFVELLSYQFANGSIPSDEKILRRILGASPKEWREIRSEIMQKFVKKDEENLINLRMEKERNEREAIREKRIQAGASGNEARWNTDRKCDPKCDDFAIDLRIASTTTTTDNKNPPTPKGGCLPGIQIPDQTKVRVGKWFRRKESTPWSDKEIRAWKKIKIEADELELLEGYYSAEMPEASDYRRTSLLTLLNNWPGEIDRARKYCKERETGKRESETPSWLPDNWREIAIKRDGQQAAEYSCHTQITPFNRHDFERACKGEIDLFGEDAA